MSYKEIINKNIKKEDGKEIKVYTFFLATDFLDILYEKNKICGDISFKSTAKSFEKYLINEVNTEKIANTLIRSYKRYYVNDKKLNVMIRKEVDKLVNDFLNVIKD